MRLKKGLFADDELSKKVKIHAAGKAYFYSLYIWIGLLAFHRFFDVDDLLIFGLIGMALSLYVSWLFTRNKKGIE